MGGFCVAAADMEVQLRGEKHKVITWLYFVLFSALYFAATLVIECVWSNFCFKDSIYAMIFYGIIGMHFIHVMVAALFIHIAIFMVKYNDIVIPIYVEHKNYKIA